MPRFDVTIAGELNLDLILYGLPEQLLPERELLAELRRWKGNAVSRKWKAQLGL